MERGDLSKPESNLIQNAGFVLLAFRQAAQEPRFGGINHACGQAADCGGPVQEGLVPTFPVPSEERLSCM